MFRGLRRCDGFQPVGWTAVKDLSAVLAGAGSDVDQPIGMAHDVDFVLDDKQRITGRFSSSSAATAPRYRRMQAGRGLVEHVHHAEQIRIELRRQTQALQFTRRQRGRAAIERQVAEPQV